MLKNYLRSFWRAMLRNKTESFINIGGLGLGMAVALMIGLWIHDEVSFDRNFENYGRIAQVKQNRTSGEQISTIDAVPIPLAVKLKASYGSHFRRVVLSSFTWNHILKTGSKSLLKQGNYMEAAIADMLTLSMKEGSRSGLEDHSSILLSASLAKALYGNVPALGKILKLDNITDLKITGVYEDLPSNSSFTNLAFIASWDTYYKADPNLVKTSQDWDFNAFKLFVELPEAQSADLVSGIIKNVKTDNVSADIKKLDPTLMLQSMSKWHLYSEFNNGINTGGAIRQVWILGLIGSFVLLLACINFMNLSTARSEKRAKEVGIRKTIGSDRSQLILQFYIESISIAMLSLVLAFGITLAALPLFNQISQKNLGILWTNPSFWVICLLFSLITGLLAGSYPALYLSSFKPVLVLKGKGLKAGYLAALPRRALVVFQFTISIILFIGTVTIFRQIRFAQTRYVGYDKQGLISMELNSATIHNHFQAFRNDLLKTRAVVETAESSGPTTGIYSSANGITWAGKNLGPTSEFLTVGTGAGFGKTVNWSLADGRNFNDDIRTDSSSVIVNEAAVTYMGLRNPVGTVINWDKKKYTVIGVIKNMIMQSPYEPVKQTIFFINPTSGNFLSIKLKPHYETTAALAAVEAVWKQFSPEEPFTYTFVDQDYQTKFTTEEKIGSLIRIFSALAILISCLGLFGMARFIAEQRIKEIGVRKVLGATVFNLWLTLSKSFVFLIAVALLLSLPLAWLLMHNWLQNYTYRINLSWDIFALAAFSAILISLLTVSYQTIRAALTNPVKTLRAE